MHIMKTLSTFLLFTSLLLQSSCMVRTCTDNSSYPSSDKEYSFIETYGVSSPAHLTMNTAGGNISTCSWDNDSVQVAFIVRKNGKVLNLSMEELKNLADIDIQQTDSTLSVSVTHMKQNHMSVGFLVKTPSKTSVNLQTSGGNIAIDGIVGKQQVRTSGGNLELANLTGPVDGITSGGNISLNHIEGNVNVTTSGGNIHASELQPELVAQTSGGNIHIEKVTGTIDVSTSGGNIKLDELAGSVKASTSGGSVSADINELAGPLELETSGGNINVSIPSRLGLNLDLSGSYVHTELRNFTGTSDKQHVEIVDKTNLKSVRLLLGMK